MGNATQLRNRKPILYTNIFRPSTYEEVEDYDRHEHEVGDQECVCCELVEDTVDVCATRRVESRRVVHFPQHENGHFNDRKLRRPEVILQDEKRRRVYNVL